MFDDFFQPAADHLGKAHFVFGSKSFCFAEKSIGNLHLCFYHDGILPSLEKGVNFSSYVHFYAVALFGSTCGCDFLGKQRMASAMMKNSTAMRKARQTSRESEGSVA